MDCICLSSETATEFAISLIQTLVTQESSSVSELFNVIDALSKVFMSVCFMLWSCLLLGLPLMLMYAVLQLAIRPGSPDSLQHLVEIARSTFNNSANYAASKDEKVIQSKDKKV